MVGTWRNLNSNGNKALLQLYFDGKLVGELRDFDHTLEWNIDEWEIRIGLGFEGKIDDFFILDRYLSEKEASNIYRSGKSLGALLGI